MSTILLIEFLQIESQEEVVLIYLKTDCITRRSGRSKEILLIENLEIVSREEVVVIYLKQIESRKEVVAIHLETDCITRRSGKMFLCSKIKIEIVMKKSIKTTRSAKSHYIRRVVKQHLNEIHSTSNVENTNELLNCGNAINFSDESIIIICYIKILIIFWLKTH
nr:uncharacterized protein LOC124816235 [Hydra vulgaris]